MFFARKKPALTRRQQLASKPIQVVEGTWTENSTGGGRFTIPLQSRKLLGGLITTPSNTTKTFEFDALGTFVWRHCDGETTVQQIARELARAYKISERESQAATEQFLVMLAKKGLIAAAVPKERGDED